jgi:hypothetical protein
VFRLERNPNVKRIEWDIYTIAEVAQYGPTGFRWSIFFFVIIYDLYKWKAVGKVEYGIIEREE